MAVGMAVGTQTPAAGFRLASEHDKPKRRLIVSAAAREKQGKTHFALTAPGPIALFDMDVGLEGVVNKFARQKQVWIGEYDYHPLAIKTGLAVSGAADPTLFLQLWEKLRADYTRILGDARIRSVVMDTGTEVWELLRLARFGKLSQVMPQHYGPVNAEFRSMLRQAYASDKNFVLLHKMKQEYVNNQRTGNWERAGFSDMGFMVQVNVVCWRDADMKFGLSIIDCRQNPDVAGMDLVQPDCSFQTLAGMVFPESDPKEWE